MFAGWTGIKLLKTLERAFLFSFLSPEELQMDATVVAHSDPAVINHHPKNCLISR